MSNLNNLCIPFYENGGTGRNTATPSAAVTGKRFVAISGARQADGTATIAPPAAGGRVYGVAEHDCPIGGKVGVLHQAQTELPVTSGGAIAVGAEVEVDAQGRVVTLAAGRAVGYAKSAAAGAGEDVRVVLYG